MTSLKFLRQLIKEAVESDPASADWEHALAVMNDYIRESSIDTDTPTVITSTSTSKEKVRIKSVIEHCSSPDRMVRQLALSAWEVCPHADFMIELLISAKLPSDTLMQIGYECASLTESMINSESDRSIFDDILQLVKEFLVNGDKRRVHTYIDRLSELHPMQSRSEDLKGIFALGRSCISPRFVITVIGYSARMFPSEIEGLKQFADVIRKYVPNPGVIS